MMSSTLRGAVTREAEQETLQCMSNELDELIAVFAETHTQTAELRRVLERTCRRAEAALAIARQIRRLRL
jgi:homoserine kinase